MADSSRLLPIVSFEDYLQEIQNPSDRYVQSSLTQIFSTQGQIAVDAVADFDRALRPLFFDEIYRFCGSILDESTLDLERRPAYLEKLDQTLEELSTHYRQLTRSLALSYPYRPSNTIVKEIFETIKSHARFQRQYFENLFQAELQARESSSEFVSDKVDQSSSPESASPDISAAEQNRDQYHSVYVDHCEGEDSNIERESAESIEDCPGRFEQVWNHLTISRDRTSAANAAQELLYIFQASTLEFGENQLRQSDIGTRAIEHLPSREFQLSLNKGVQESVESHPQNPRSLHLHRIVPRITSHHYNVGTVSKRTKAWVACSGLDPTVENEKEELLLHQPLDPKLDTICASSESKPNMPSDELYNHLRKQIASLEDENKTLKNSTSGHQQWQILHFIQKGGQRQQAVAYIDEPSWMMDPHAGPVLTAYLPVTDVKGFLRQRPGLAFVVSRYYPSHEQREDVVRASREQEALPKAQWFRESISLNSEEMMSAAQAFFDQVPNFKQGFPEFDVEEHIEAPYLFWYHYRGGERPKLAGLSPDQQALIELLTNWIEENYKGMYDLVASQMSKGVISQETMPFLFKPGDVAVWEDKDGISAAVLKSWLRQDHTPTLRRKPREREWSDEPSSKTSNYLIYWSMDTWSYKYDGRLLKSPEELSIEFNTNWMDEEIEIRSLNIFPLQFAPEDVKTVLEKRGKTFWKCRYRNVISYEDTSGVYGNGERFVVDFQTYQQLHSDSVNFRKVYSNLYNDDCELMSAEMMESADPPPSPDLYVLPSTTPGYDLRSKKWVDLHVDLIQDVTWNKKSFNHLVVDDETKELVQALVRHQIAAEKSTDIIDRKGNGLIMLLHGGPGTGKTFTAESVAELAEKPLFRVTCGDISTDPEGAEKYLNSVLHLGKTWGCVVLIDEAEVFLEQRSLDNLERNALVSVFLRVLEYYEGILILTSNRVGTFDEAFKSRILLSLHYENLTQGQRKKIWKNFLRRLKEMETDTKPVLTGAAGKFGHNKPPEEEVSEIDFDDVECYLDELSQIDLNGRQIRNAITSARQLAMFRKQAMAYRHLKHVISVSSKFDNYLKKVQEGQTADQIARSDGIR